MKIKNIITIAAAAIAITASADELTPQQYRDLADEIVANYSPTNIMTAEREVIKSLRFCGAEYDAVRVSIDNDFGANGIPLSFWDADVFPKACRCEWVQFGYTNAFPVCTALMDKYGVAPQVYHFVRKGATVEELITLFAEKLQPFQLYNGHLELFDAHKRHIRDAVAKNIKRILRNKGVSFVTVGDYNPCEEAMTELTTALNAPRMNGLGAWCLKYGIEVTVDVSRLPTDTEISALKESVFYGDKPMSPENKFLLYVCLGVDEYNKFVKEYNGENN